MNSLKCKFLKKTTESFSSKPDGTISYWLDPALRVIPGQNEEKSCEIIVCKKITESEKLSSND